MSLSLLTLNNDVMPILLKNLDKESHLILGLVSKELYKTLKELNPDEKLTASLKYLTSSLSLLKYGHLNSCLWTTKTIDIIVRSNERVECVKYAIENDCPWIEFKCPTTTDNGLIVTPQECLKYLNGDGCPWPTRCDTAARYGYLECLKYLHENGCPFNDYTLGHSVINGHLECLKYLHENGCPFNDYRLGDTCSDAALYGKLECLKYLSNNGQHWNHITARNAASNGHLDCLKYARENGCPWDENTCSMAALGGHLECMKYAHENGCPWDESTCSCATENGQLECLKYARDNGCPEWQDQLYSYGDRYFRMFKICSRKWLSFVRNYL
jgi:hypothetical protein